MSDGVVLFCHDGILRLSMTIVNAAGDGVIILFICMWIKYSYKETREIKFQTLRRRSRSLEHAAMQWRGR